MGFKPKTMVERVLADYYDGFSSLRCMSAEARAEAIGPTAGSPSWIPTFQKGASRGPENWLVRRCDISMALAKLDEAYQWLLMLRIGQEWSFDKIGTSIGVATMTVWRSYSAAKGVAQVELEKREVIRRGV